MDTRDKHTSVRFNSSICRSVPWRSRNTRLSSRPPSRDPIADDGVNADLAETLSLPLLIVVADKLGCINHILLTIEAAKARGLDIAAIVLNKIQQDAVDSELDNISLLKKHTSIPIAQTDYAEDYRTDVTKLVDILKKTNRI